MDREIFKETSLPPKESFYSKLKIECVVTEEEYECAEQMWNRYGCQTMEDYTMLHMTLETVLFADVFEQFCQFAFQQYGLDPAHCWTLLGYKWQAALKFTGMQLELITDLDIFLMVESAIREGISMVCNRLATANNKYLKSYDISKPHHLLCRGMLSICTDIVCFLSYRAVLGDLENFAECWHLIRKHLLLHIYYTMPKTTACTFSF